MTPDKLEQIGQLLYGPSWRAALAKALNVAERTVRRWMAGNPIPDAVPDDLAQLCEDRMIKLGIEATRLRQEQRK